MLGARGVGVGRAGRALVGALVVMGAMELATAGGHLGVAAVLERASDCFAVEQCEREYEHAFDETPLRTFGVGLAGAAVTVTVGLQRRTTAMSLGVGSRLHPHRSTAQETT